MSGNHRAFHAQFRIQDAINARLEEISFRKGVATGASALLFLTGLSVVTAELAGQGNPASGALIGQAGGVPSTSMTHPGLASVPGSVAPSHPLRRPHAQPRPSSHPTADRSTPGTASSVPGQGSGTGGIWAPAPAVSATPSAGFSRPGSDHWWHGGRDRDGWHHGNRGWNGWGPGGGDPWHGGRHW